jgi:hypothetical protein
MRDAPPTLDRGPREGSVAAKRGKGPTRAKGRALARPEVREIAMSGDLDRRAAEAVRLELWGLARRYKIRVRGLRVEPAAE